MLRRWQRCALWLAVPCGQACNSTSTGPGARDAGDTQLDAAASGGQNAAGRKADAADSGKHDAAAPSTLDSLLSQELFDKLFPHRADSACNAQVYDHAALIAAAARFPAFASQGSDALRKRELAAFLANISHETTGGWPTAPDGPNAWGLCFREERGCEQGSCTQYCDGTNARYPCAPGQTYHGRGPLQLSWNYNYGQVGDALQLDLLHDPGRVTRDGVVGFETALWFWMTPQAPKPSAHDVMIGAWQPSAADTGAGRLPGFGTTVNIINGGLECGIAHDRRVEDRVAFYERYVSVLGTDAGDNLRCETTKSF